MSGAHVDLVLKADALGRVERVVAPDGSVRVRRVACGGTILGSRFVARRLLAREERALRLLEGLEGVPRLLEVAPGILERSWIEGTPLSRTESLPQDFFDRLDDLVRALHARGVCHNDLHKEQNVLVAADGWPALLDFQLASIHRPGSRAGTSRARDDLRHVEKHRRRYTRDGRGPAGVPESRGAGHGIRRSTTALVWRRTVKPAYVFVTRKLLATRDGEPRRESTGPWPRWSPPLRPGS
ncbi:MAG: serine/threonine protein kinase [Planctomycetota bacterium]